jgi:hypothetical protein
MAILDVFKSKWQNSNPQVREAAVRELSADDLDALLQVAATDSVPAIRRIAIQKIPLPEALEGLVQTEQDAELRALLQSRLLAEWSRMAKAHNAPIDAFLAEKLSLILASEYLEDVVKNAVSAEVRRHLVQNTNRQSVLALAAKRDADESVALAALAALDNTNMLEDVSENSRHNSVRGKAASKLLDLRVKAAGESGAAAGDSVLRAKRNALLGQAQRLSDAKNPLASEDEFHNVMAAAAQLGMGEFEAPLYALFNSFEERCEVERHRIKIREADEAKAKALAEQRAKEQAAREEAARRQWAAQQAQAGEDGNGENGYSEGYDDSYQQGYSNYQNGGYGYQNNGYQNHYGYQRQQGLAPEVYEQKLAQLYAIIDRVNNIDENQEFSEISKQLRDAYLEWMGIVGENKYQFRDAWQIFKEAQNRFQEMRQWDAWHNEREREALIEEMEHLAASEPSAEVLSEARGLHYKWKTAGHVHPQKLTEMWERFKGAFDQVVDRAAPILEMQAQEQQVALERRRGIVAQIQGLAQDATGDWREQFKTIKGLQEEWKTAGRVPKDEIPGLWDSYHAACDLFFDRQKRYQAEQDNKRTNNLQKKEDICKEAETLAESSDWVPTAARFKKLQNLWKTTGPVPREALEGLWDRFRIACDKFFTRRKEYFEQQNNARESNLKRKEEICERLETVQLDAKDPMQVKEVDDLLAEWKSIGVVPKEKNDELWRRFLSASDRVTELKSEADPVLKQELDANYQGKTTIIEQVKALTEDAGNSRSAQLVRDLQEQWKQVGRCGIRENAVYTDFRAACNEFFQVRRDQIEIKNQARTGNLQRKLALCDQAEHLLEHDFTKDEVSAEIAHLRKTWRDIGDVPREAAEAVWHRFDVACNNAYHSFDNKPEG